MKLLWIILILCMTILPGCSAAEPNTEAFAAEHQITLPEVELDILAPVVEVRSIELEEVRELTPADFTVSISDESEVTANFRYPIDYTDTNRQTIVLVYEDVNGNRTVCETSLRISKLKPQVTTELDEGMPDILEFLKNPEDAEWAIFAEEYVTNTPGSRIIGIYIGDMMYESELVVIDTIPPSVLLAPLTINWGETASAADFIERLLEESETTITFVNQPDWDKLGEQTVEISVKDAGENEVFGETTLTILPDTEGPVFTGVEDRLVEKDTAIAYKKGVKAIDSHDGEVEVFVDSSAVNYHVVGEYPVTYSAKDMSGNETTQTVTFSVVSSVGDYDELQRRILELKDQLITPDMTLREQAYKIFRFGKKIKYTGFSNKEDWVAAALDGLEKGSGDCYTAFIISKLLLDACGIPNLDVERLRYPGESRHYWSIVNCGDGWYYFDSNVHSAEYQFETFMFTEEERIAYCNMRGGDGYFYRYDKSLYDIEVVQGEPVVMTKVELEPEITEPTEGEVMNPTEGTTPENPEEVTEPTEGTTTPENPEEGIG